MTSRSAAAHHLSDLARLRRVRDRIDREYAQPLDVQALACGVHMSAGHLSREFRLAYGESPYAYLMTRRMERAMALLRRGDLSVTEVCFAVGCEERPCLLLGDVVAGLAPPPGKPDKQHDAYPKHGRGGGRAAVAPLTGQRR